MDQVEGKAMKPNLDRVSLILGKIGETKYHFAAGLAEKLNPEIPIEFVFGFDDLFKLDLKKEMNLIFRNLDPFEVLLRDMFPHVTAESTLAFLTSMWKRKTARESNRSWLYYIGISVNDLLLFVRKYLYPDSHVSVLKPLVLSHLFLVVSETEAKIGFEGKNVFTADPVDSQILETLRQKHKASVESKAREIRERMGKWRP